MDLEFESEEAKNTYNKCKYVVKLWEHNFKKEKGRLPSKLDIRESNVEVRKAYKTYYLLKTKTLELSFRDVDGFDFDTENIELSQTSTTVDSDDQINNLYYESQKITNETDKESNASQNSTENLTPVTDKPLLNLENAKSSTPKPTKSTNKSYINKTVRQSFAATKFAKRNPRKSIHLTKKNSTEKIDNSQPDNNNVDETSNPSNSQPNVPDSSEPECSFNLSRNVKIVQDVQKDHTTSISLYQNDSNINNKSLRSLNTQWIDRITKSTLLSVSSAGPLDTIENKNDDTVEIDEPLTSSQKNYNSDDLVSSSDDEVLSQPAKKRKIDETFRRSNSFQTIQKKAANNILQRSFSTQNLQSQPSPKVTLSKPNFKNISSLNEDFMQKSKDEIVEEKPKPPEGLPNVQNKEDNSVVRKRTLRKREPKTVKIDDKRQREKASFEKKVSSGTLNDNYVRVNLKKKTYSRGNKTLNFSKYKKGEWKKRRNWAQKNEEENTTELLPLEAYEDSCSLPTIDEVLARDNEDLGSDSEFLQDKEKLLQILEDNPFDEIEMANSETVEPYYNSDAQISNTPKEVHETLEKFGYKSFRPGQELAVMRILSGKSTLVTLSTGSGKSLCYQLPAYIYSRRDKCITLVISPLVSLMDDQVDNVPAFINAACFHSGMSMPQKQKVIDAIAAENVDILFLSPEILVSGERSGGLRSILQILPPIAFACIDEAHCVSQWSHNFRPSYLLLCKVLRDYLKVNTLLGLTATATKATINSIVNHFEIADDKEGVITDIPIPNNLNLTVSMVRNKERQLINLISSEEFSEYNSIIIYCTRRDICEQVASILRSSLTNAKTGQKRKRYSVVAEAYHAGLSKSRRKIVQKSFMADELRIVVATVAFGMGINKADIRAVIHYDLPKSVESYVQEVGRAGRDREPAHCHAYLDPDEMDVKELQKHVYSDSVDRHILRKLLKKVFMQCSCESDCPKHEVCFSIKGTIEELDLPEENISTILCYLELHKMKYVELLSPAYGNCKIIYANPKILNSAAKQCIPLAAALKLYKNNVTKGVFEFPICPVALQIAWKTGFCKKMLKNLEWTTETGESKRSGLHVQFSDLSFRVSAPGNLSKTDLDELLNDIYSQTVENERISLGQLQAIHTLLKEASVKTFDDSNDEDNCDSKEDSIKLKIREYFISDNPLDSLPKIEPKKLNEERLIGDIRTLVATYRDSSFTGRAVARIFHGIQSPNYPARIWGRTRFWRAHLDADFHSVTRIATQEIIKMN